MRGLQFLLFLHLLRFYAAGIVNNITVDVTDGVRANVTDDVLADGATRPNFFEAFGQGIQKEIQTIRQPIDEVIINLGFTACEHLQKFFGISYEQMQGEKEPNMSTLALVYRTKNFTKIMNISEAPETLHLMRRSDVDQRLIMFVHGFTDDPSKEGFNNLTQSFFVGEHTSLLALDASSHIRWWYFRSSTFVRFIGQKLGECLAALVKRGQDPSLIHIMGNSLGGHIAGFAGKAFYALTKKLIGRISGLDPAGPCFSRVGADLRLRHSDAAFVDVVHTDAGVFGIKDAVGHKDYYPNNGFMQPHCVLQACSHTRSWLLYGESVVRPLAFPAVRCKDWEAFKKGECDSEISYMGYSSKPGGSNGLYFLQTGGKYPYGLGPEGIKYRNTDGIIQAIGNFFG